MEVDWDGSVVEGVLAWMGSAGLCKVAIAGSLPSGPDLLPWLILGECWIDTMVLFRCRKKDSCTRA